jgi:dynein assembly factor 5
MKEALIVDLQGLDDVLEPLRALTSDKTPAVREALHSTAGEWLLKLPDRYSIGYKILPLLLAGLSDEMPHLSTKSLNYMNEAGKLYEQEWEDRVKDEMDYTDGRDALSGVTISYFVLHKAHL